MRPRTEVRGIKVLRGLRSVLLGPAEAPRLQLLVSWSLPRRDEPRSTASALGPWRPRAPLWARGKKAAEGPRQGQRWEEEDGRKEAGRAGARVRGLQRDLAAGQQRLHGVVGLVLELG